MTAEAAILNKTGVALAADSAVTITSVGGRRAHSKIYVDANKLFELIKGRPVGVMIYDSAELGGVPWENIIKAYRRDRRDMTFGSLQDYAQDLLDFIESAICPRISEYALVRQVTDLSDTFFKALLGQVEQPQAPAERKRLQRRKRFADVVDAVAGQLDDVALQDWANGLDENWLWRTHREMFTATIPEKVEEFTLPKALRMRTAKTILRLTVRSEQLGGSRTGVVVAGFGEDELYPSICHADLHGFLAGRLIALQKSIDSVTDEAPSIIRPFAQTSEATTFLQGIDPAVSREISAFWREWSGGIRNAATAIVRKESPRMSSGTLDGIGDRINEFMSDSWSAFAQYMTDFHERRKAPIEASAAFLSKGEIASLAENLVDLASLRDRVTLDRQETVGGATDVGVISRGDGFIWIKRKHYFDLGFNPTWPANQTASPIHLTQELATGEGRTDGDV